MTKLLHTARREFPLILALGLVGSVLGGLIVGYEPTGGDPDRLYRPLKTELSRALRAGKLPFWSDRLGLGVPLVAESHVAAFYLPNLFLYRVLDVSTAYRLSMWLHYVALVATSYLLGRSMGITPWGSALGAVAFALCGFQAIHSSHEPFYGLMPYLPLALALLELYVATGRMCWLAFLVLALGLQWTVGHFQIQMWTSGLVVLFGFWHAAFQPRLWRRAVGAIAAVALGMALAAVQLGLSWQFASLVNQVERSTAERSFYSFPPAHWFELAAPRPVRELRMGPEDPYWFREQTTGYEAACYIGTIPLILAIVGYFRHPASRSAMLWRLIAPLAFALATMPRWWPAGYAQILAIPGLGYFRVPARYTLLSSLALALVAGEGFDRSISRFTFRLGLTAALVFAGCALLAAALWSMRPIVHLGSTFAGLASGIVWAALAWLAALGAIGIWRSGRFGAWVPLVATAIELGILFHMGTTHWGWSIRLPQQSPVLSELTHRSDAALIGGEIENLPLWANLATAFPYLGFEHAYPNRFLVSLQRRLLAGETGVSLPPADVVALRRWLRRCRVSHLVGPSAALATLGAPVSRWRDPALDQIVYRRPDQPLERSWSIVHLEDPFPEIHVASRAVAIADRAILFDRLSRSDDRDVAYFLATDGVPARPPAQSARLLSWDGSTTEAMAVVEHDSPCDLIVSRTYDPGWHARIDGGPEIPVVPVNGGFVGVRIEGAGTHRVALHYAPPRFVLWAAISAVAAGVIVLVLVGSLAATRERS
jgi:hypothetical protein